MKPGIRSFRFLRLVLVGIALASVAAGVCQAQSFSWSSPMGTITVFGSGDLTTYLQTEARLASVEEVGMLSFLAAESSPAVLRSDATTSGGSFSSLAQLSINESEAYGLPMIDGSVGFSAQGAGNGTGSSRVKIFFLISVPVPTMIDLVGIRSGVDVAGAPSDAFSLKLYQSDAAGTITGNAVLSLSGEMFDENVSYQSSSPYYLLEMDAFASATTSYADDVVFSYGLDLRAVPVPEPNALVLVVGGLVFAVGIFRWRKLQRSSKDWM